jgi:Zn ribbon nucleic-acid-binding protein
MNFENPLRLDCPGCSMALTLPLWEVIGLEARCEGCGYSLREFGLAMRRQANEMTRLFVTWETVWLFEAEHAFEAEDEAVQAIETPADLVAYLRRMAGDELPEEAVLEALASRIRRPLDASHLRTPITELVPDPMLTQRED